MTSSPDEMRFESDDVIALTPGTNSHMHPCVVLVCLRACCADIPLCLPPRCRCAGRKHEVAYLYRTGLGGRRFVPACLSLGNLWLRSWSCLVLRLHLVCVQERAAVSGRRREQRAGESPACLCTLPFNQLGRLATLSQPCPLLLLVSPRSCVQLHSWLLAVTATHPKVGNVYDVDLKVPSASSHVPFVGAWTYSCRCGVSCAKQIGVASKQRFAYENSYKTSRTYHIDSRHVWFELACFH